MRVLNLGAGVQSTTVFLMSHEGLIDPIEHAIFGDTQEEPKAVYEHLQWLRTVPEPVPIIHVGTAGKLGDDLLHEETPSNRGTRHLKEHHRHRFASIPLFTAEHHERRAAHGPLNEGIVQRQCTKEYKIEIVERIIRRDLFGLKPKQRLPKGTQVTQVFGISYEERGRAVRIARRYERIWWAKPEFPLIDMHMTREKCKEWLKTRVPHEVPRSACVFCPFKSTEEWIRTKQSPAEWARALEIDRGLREEGRAVNRRMDQTLYLHRSCIPLELVDFDALAAKEAAKKYRSPGLFAAFDCEGMCGN